MTGNTVRQCLLAAAFAPLAALTAAPRDVSFFQPPRSVEPYDFFDVSANVTAPDAGNPFMEATLTGWFAKAGGGDRISVEGFCDSADGSVFRIGFMPSSPGDYTYSVLYRQGSFEKSHSGTFRAAGGRRKGLSGWIATIPGTSSGRERASTIFSTKRPLSG
jgi:hypothetical protein